MTKFKAKFIIVDGKKKETITKTSGVQIRQICLKTETSETKGTSTSQLTIYPLGEQA